MRTQTVLDALEMARWSRGARLEGLITHADAGSQFTSIRYGERLDELGAVPSIGSVGDSYDNALAEAVNALFKTELIRGPGQGPWRTVDDVELATLDGCTGGTPNASTATSATLHPMTSKRLTLPETPTTTQQKTKTHTLRKTQGESFSLSFSIGQQPDIHVGISVRLVSLVDPARIIINQCKAVFAKSC